MFSEKSMCADSRVWLVTRVITRIGRGQHLFSRSGQSRGAFRRDGIMARIIVLLVLAMLGVCYATPNPKFVAGKIRSHSGTPAGASDDPKVVRHLVRAYVCAHACVCAMGASGVLQVWQESLQPPSGAVKVMHPPSCAYACACACACPCACACARVCVHMHVCMCLSLCDVRVLQVPLVTPCDATFHYANTVALDLVKRVTINGHGFNVAVPQNEKQDEEVRAMPSPWFRPNRRGISFFFLGQGLGGRYLKPQHGMLFDYSSNPHALRFWMKALPSHRASCGHRSPGGPHCTVAILHGGHIARWPYRIV